MSQKLLLGVAVAVALLAAVVPDLTTYYGVALVLIGLLSGFMYPIADVTTRIAYYVLAVFLPIIADAGGERGTPDDGALLQIPVVGEYLVGFLVNITAVIAGVAIACVLLSLYNGLTAAGDD
jgi:hypothetical protein